MYKVSLLHENNVIESFCKAQKEQAIKSAKGKVDFEWLVHGKTVSAYICSDHFDCYISRFETIIY